MHRTERAEQAMHRTEQAGQAEQKVAP